MTEPTPAELAEIWDMPDGLAPARSILFALAITVITVGLVAVGIIGYFRFFN